MRIIPPSHVIMFMPSGQEIIENLELAGRTCYKSEDKITPQSAEGFIRRLIKSGHHSVIEHASVTVRFTCDRGVSHELVRHRLASFTARKVHPLRQLFQGQVRLGDNRHPAFFLGNRGPGRSTSCGKRPCRIAENAYLELLDRLPGQSPRRPGLYCPTA